MPSIRESQEDLEMMVLSQYACLSRNTRGREHDETECDVRTSFQRDRDRIVHCKAFRRLKHKTQVFISPEGDHYRTRLTHTLEVSQIARTVARALRLNEDLTEAISLGHDLGHTPFGHAGETALDGIHQGGFKHNVQSLRIVDHLESKGDMYPGLNLTWEVRDGILNHPGSAGKPATLEGRIVKFADRIAYINHDIDDAIRGGIIDQSDLPEECVAVLGNRTGTAIDVLVRDLIATSWDRDEIHLSQGINDVMVKLRKFLFEHVYVGSKAKVEEHKAASIIRAMYGYYMDKPDMLEMETGKDPRGEGIPTAACDYIAGMTDRFITASFIRHFVPHAWSQPF